MSLEQRHDDQMTLIKDNWLTMFYCILHVQVKVIGKRQTHSNCLHFLIGITVNSFTV